VNQESAVNKAIKDRQQAGSDLQGAARLSGPLWRRYIFKQGS
tara:strand:- start:693 stop:818 length:126 start_codon:yes stop_codon:yes gene_type:complete